MSAVCQSVTCCPVELYPDGAVSAGGVVSYPPAQYTASGTRNVAFSTTVAAFPNATAPCTFTVASSGAGRTLPTGLSLNSSTGAITGTPTVSGVSRVTISIEDAVTRIAYKEYTITIT